MEISYKINNWNYGTVPNDNWHALITLHTTVKARYKILTKPPTVFMFYSIYLYVFTRPSQPTSRCSQHFQHTSHPTLQCFTPVPTHLTVLILFLVPFRGFMPCPTHVVTTFKHFPHLSKPILHCSSTSHPTPRCSKPQYSPTQTTIRRPHTSYPLTVSTVFLIHLVFFKSFQTHITIFTSLPTHFTVFNNWTQFRFNALSNSSHSVYQTQITFQTLFTLSKPTSVFTLFSIHTMLQSYPSLGVPVFSNPFHIVHNVPNPSHGVHTFQT